MKTTKNTTPNRKQIMANLETFMAGFPDKPKGWNEATGELASIHSTMAEFFEEYTAHQGYSKTPAECNRRHKAGIRNLAAKMTDRDLNEVHEFYLGWLAPKQKRKKI